MSMPDFIEKNQFPAPLDTVFFSSDSRDVVLNRVTPYFPFRNGRRSIDHSYLQGDYGLAMNGLNITLGEFINWDSRLRNDELLKPTTKDLMWQQFPYTKDDHYFVYSWDAPNLNGHPSYGFSGSLVTCYRTFPDDDMSIILFCNGLGRFFSVENVVNHLASIVDADIVDPNNLAFEALLISADKDMAAFKTTYKKLKNDFPDANYEATINAVGYSVMNNNNLALATEIFVLNTKEFPDAWNVFDSLGEAYLNANDSENATLDYEKSLALNPENENGKRMLAEIAKRK